MCLESFWLLHIHFLLYHTIHENYLHVHMVYLPFHHCGYCKNGPNRSVCHHKRKCLLIIYSLFLVETSCHKPCLVLLYVAICCMLYLVDPLGTDDCIFLWCQDHIPEIILYDWLVLFNHGIFPFFLLHGFFITGRLCINDVAQ